MTAPASPPTVPSRARVQALEYAIMAHHPPLLLDLYRPASEAPVAVVVFVHGGGWRAGTRSSLGPMYRDWSPSPFEEIVAAGIAVASVDYRLSGDAIFPAQLDDVTTALEWVRAQGPTLGLDVGRIALWGESAGGHLAALVGLTRPGVRAVVDWYGPSDLTAMAGDAADSDDVEGDPSSPDSRESTLLGGPADTVTALAAAASPVTYVHADAPPFLLLHGTADRGVPTAQSQRLAAALTACGASADLRLIEGADHLWSGDPSIARTAFDTSLAFLLTHLT